MSYLYGRDGRGSRVLPVSATVQDKDGVTHVVKQQWSRGFNGTDYATGCRLHLSSGENWAHPVREVPTCLRCLATT